MKHTLAVIVIAGGLLGYGAAPALANHQGGCPDGDGWFLAPSSAVIPEVDNGNQKDQNGDGLVCARVNKGQSEKNAFPSWTVKDNTNPLP